MLKRMEKTPSAVAPGPGFSSVFRHMYPPETSGSRSAMATLSLTLRPRAPEVWGRGWEIIRPSGAFGVVSEV